MPTKRLPRELLAYILQAYVDLDLSPFVLALVCHEWRSITLQTRTLWRYILVVDTVRGLRRTIYLSIPEFNDKLSMIGKRQVCSTRDQLDNAIARAGSVALDITVQFTNDIEVSPSAHAMKMCLSVFGDQGIIARAATLSIAQLPNLPNSHPTWIKLCVPSRLALKTFSCTHIGWMWVPFIRRMLSSSHELTSVELPLSLQDELRESRIWDSLRHFYLTQEQFGEISLSPKSSINIILSKCRSIENIVLSPTPWPSANTTPSNYARLRYAVLHSEIRFLARLHAPWLTFLSLYDMTVGGSQLTESIRLELPSLKTLLADTPDPGWIYKSQFPRLASLTITLTRLSTYPSILRFIPSGLPGVLDVTIKGFDVHPVISLVLQSVPNAQTIKIIPCNRNEGLLPILGLELKLFFAPESSILAPKAQSIQLGNAQAKIGYPRRAIEPLIIETRKRRGPFLQSLTVHWEGPLPSEVEYA
ncbi:hypothetical protein FRC19_009197 [Serendipita sp. 401]|nr:hypothetical protein FRC19_009197 [Serendipita sp. 401]